MTVLVINLIVLGIAAAVSIAGAGMLIYTIAADIVKGA